jgi:hypothetical protein
MSKPTDLATCYESNGQVLTQIYEPNGNALTIGEIVCIINDQAEEIWRLKQRHEVALDIIEEDGDEIRRLKAEIERLRDRVALADTQLSLAAREVTG